MTEVSFTSPKLAQEEEQPTRGKSVFDNLLDEVSAPANVESEKIIKVPGRDRITLKINTKLPLQRLTTMRKIATTNKKTGEMDIALLNTALVVAQTECLQYDGQDAVNRETGELVDFKDPELQSSLRVIEARAAVQALIPRDADLLRVGGEILDACGYGEEEEDDDPLDFDLG